MKMLLSMITDFSTIKKEENSPMHSSLGRCQWDKSVSTLFTDNKSGQFLKMVAWWERLLSTVLKHASQILSWVFISTSCLYLCFYTCKIMFDPFKNCYIGLSLGLS